MLLAKISALLFFVTTAPASAQELDATFASRITQTAGDSACAHYRWKSRGISPNGYPKGMALSFARSVCRLSSPGSSIRTPAELMSRASTKNASKDALEWYRTQFETLHLEVDRSGVEALRSLYTLGMGLGMRESSGKYCEGWDRAAGANRSASQAEAGPFQSSYDSMGASGELKKLYDEYRKDTSRCQLSTYKEGVTCRAQDILGKGAGAEFQKLAKSCPAFAAEYAMTSLRVLRKHYGPINRREAEVIQSCNQMLEDVQRIVEQDPFNACLELL